MICPACKKDTLSTDKCSNCKTILWPAIAIHVEPLSLHLCSYCGSHLANPRECPKHGKLARPGLTWDEEDENYLTLTWLAQSKRRFVYPLESTERTGMSAFEYGWKAFNSMYRVYPGDKDKDKWRLLFDDHLNKEHFLWQMQKYEGFVAIASICSDVQMGIFDVRGDDDTESQTMVEWGKEHADRLREMVERRNPQLINKMVDLFYIFRNARFHGAQLVASSQVFSQDGEVSAWGVRLKGSRFLRFPISLYHLNLHLLCNKCRIYSRAAEEVIDISIDDWLDEIKHTVHELEAEA